jgi:hypothetical protein
MNHDLRLQAGGWYLCHHCGQRFHSQATLQTVMASPCQKPYKTSHTTGNWRIEAMTHAPSALEPCDSSQDQTDKGARLLDGWLRETEDDD